MQAGYFVAVIRLSEIPPTKEDVVGFDSDGRVQDWGADIEAPAVLVVAPVDEAVKTLEDGVIAGELDRDDLWSVAGFVLTRDVIESLDADELSVEELIEEVSRAGYRWRIRIVAS